MEMSWWRDLVIVIWGVVAMIAVLLISVIVIILYRRANKLLDSANSIADRTNDLIDYAEEEVLKPAVQFGGMLQGIIQGAGLIVDMFKKKEGKKDE